MSSKPYIQFYISDFLGDVAHLSCEEIGAFMLLLMQCWQKGFIPSNDEVLCRLTRLSLNEWLAMKDTIIEFFKPCDKGYYNARATKELDKIAEKSSKAKHSADIRWGKKDDANASETHMRTHNERITERNAIPDTRYQIPDPTFQSPEIKTPLPPFSKGEKIIEKFQEEKKSEAGEGNQNPIKKMTRAETLRSVTEEEQGAIEKIFAHWKKLAGHPTCHLESKRTLAILNGLRLGYTVEQCLDAVDGCFKTPHNMGDNKQGANHDRLGLIFRDADHIENFIRNKKNPPTPVGEGAAKKVEAKKFYSTAAESALTTVCHTLRQFSNKNSMIFRDEKVHAVIDSLGGLGKIDFPNGDIAKFHNDFKARYDDLKDDWLSSYSPVLEVVASNEFSALVAYNPRTGKVEKIDSEKIDEFKALAVQNKKRLNLKKGD